MVADTRSSAVVAKAGVWSGRVLQGMRRRRCATESLCEVFRLPGVACWAAAQVKSPPSDPCPVFCSECPTGVALPSTTGMFVEAVPVAGPSVDVKERRAVGPFFTLGAFTWV